MCLIGPLIEASTCQLVHCLLFEPKSKDGWFCRNERKSKSTTLVLIQRLAAGSSQRPNNCSHFHHYQALPTTAASPRDKLSQTIFGGFSMAKSCNLRRRTRFKSFHMACFITPEPLMQSLKTFQIREKINYHLGIRESYYAMCD